MPERRPINDSLPTRVYAFRNYFTELQESYKHSGMIIKFEDETAATSKLSILNMIAAKLPYSDSNPSTNWSTIIFCTSKSDIVAATGKIKKHSKTKNIKATVKVLGSNEPLFDGTNQYIMLLGIYF